MSKSPSDTERGQVRDTLERVVASQAFRKSEQCQKFLRYVVVHSLDGHEDSLHERSIGIDVFGRRPDYDTAEDPVVRVRAGEVRKRLAQYYGESPAPGDVRFEIPSGSYRVEFRHAAAPAARRRFGFWWVAAAAVVVAVPVVLVNRLKPSLTALDRFWAPAYSSSKPVLLYCGQPVVYFLSREVHEKFRPPGEQRGSYAVQLDPGAVLHGSDIIPVTDQFVGIGNAHTAAMLSMMMAARQKPVEIRYANDISFSDLRSGPSVLIGAFSNLWTLEMQDQLRLVFEQEGAVRRIRDKSAGKTWQLTGLAPDGKTSEDYAIVSRVFHSGTGQLLVSAAGITQYGTRAAGEFLTSPALLEEALGSAEWPRKNVQVLLHTAIHHGTPASPTVVASHVW